MINYIELWDKFFRGATSSSEESVLQEWLCDKSEPDAELTEYYQTRWESVSGQMDADVKLRIRSRIEACMGDCEHEACMDDCEHDAERNPCEKSAGRIHWNVMIPWAAAVCLAVAACAGWFKYAQAGGGNDDLFEVFTERGQKANIILPDGTRVWLNSDSRLSYGNDYNSDRRDVALSGEGYFEVSGDAERPFCVSTGSYTVEALGTAFNIRAYPDDRYSVTTLMEGQIRIEDDNGFTAILAPTESLSFDAESGRFRRNDSYRSCFAGDWRRNELIVDRGTTLEMLTYILSRQYNIGFGFRSDAIKQIPFEGVIRDSNLDNVMQLISLSGEVAYTIEDNTVILDAKKSGPTETTNLKRSVK